MKVYRSHEYSSRGSSARTHHLHPLHLPFLPCFSNPTPPPPPPHSLLFTKTFHLTLLHYCHPITLFLSLIFSLSLFHGRIAKELMTYSHTLFICLIYSSRNYLSFFPLSLRWTENHVLSKNRNCMSVCGWSRNSSLRLIDKYCAAAKDSIS